MSQAPGSPNESRLIVELTAGPRESVPYFLISGVGGHVLPLQPLTRCIELRQGLGVIYPGFVDSEKNYETVEDTAERMLRDIRAARPNGPYLLVGYSFGGILGFEIASRLSEMDEKVGLVLIDSRHRKIGKERSLPGKLIARARAMIDREYRGRTAMYFKRKIKDRLKRFWLLRSRPTSELSDVQRQFARVRADGLTAIRRYRPDSADVVAVLLKREDRPADNVHMVKEPDYGWGRFLNLAGIMTVEGGHLEMFKAPHCESLARELETALDMLEAKIVTS